MYASWHGEIFAGKSFEVHKRPWVSRLTGLWPNGQIKRQFMRGLHDYTHGQAHHSRGVYLYFTLPPGLYEFFRPVSWRRDERFWGRVTEQGEIEAMTREEIMQCLKSDTSA